VWGQPAAPLRARLGDALDMVRAVGARGMATEMPRWLIRREFVVLAGDLHDRLPAAAPPSELRLDLLTPADAPALAQLHPMMSREEVRRRWAEGQECILGWMGPAPVYYRWDVAGPAYLPYLRKTLHPPPRTVLTLDVRTHPRFQGQGIGVFAAALANCRGLERGQRRRLGLVARWNHHVVRYNLAFGASALGTVGYWYAVLRRLYFATGDIRVERDTIVVASA
jgi:GNAT superfamily N-acetyltransferase